MKSVKYQLKKNAYRVPETDLFFALLNKFFGSGIWVKLRDRFIIRRTVQQQGTQTEELPFHERLKNKRRATFIQSFKIKEVTVSSFKYHNSKEITEHIYSKIHLSKLKNSFHSYFRVGISILGLGTYDLITILPLEVEIFQQKILCSVSVRRL